MNVKVHAAVAPQLEALVAHPGGTMLLHGAPQVGKRTIARDLARRLNCEGCSDQSCRGCRMALGGNHPNILLVEPDEKGKIGVEAIHELQHNLVYEQYEVAGQRVVLVLGADTVTLPAQNALLKTLEEPPTGTTIILTAASASVLLPTVLSRCTQIFVPILAAAEIAAYLVEEMNVVADQAATIAGLSYGALGRAVTYVADNERYREDQIITEQVRALTHGGSLFARLQVASGLAVQTTQQRRVLDSLTAIARQDARGGVKNAVMLMATQRLRERLKANVNAKAAFEAMALELS